LDGGQSIVGMKHSVPIGTQGVYDEGHHGLALVGDDNPSPPEDPGPPGTHL
jgi:hypothetical protein